MSKSKKGFTVVEVLCVTTILLIITSFTVPQIWRAIDEAYNVSARFSISAIESMYRLSRTFMLIDSDAPDTPQPQALDYEIHIPSRYGEAQTNYTRYMEQKIAEKYGTNVPIYEITETVSQSGTSRTIRYWPTLENEKGKCYELKGGKLTVTTIERPETHTWHPKADAETKAEQEAANAQLNKDTNKKPA